MLVNNLNKQDLSKTFKRLISETRIKTMTVPLLNILITCSPLRTSIKTTSSDQNSMLMVSLTLRKLLTSTR